MLISICIPTKDRADLLDETLQSIFDEPVDRSLFEIVVSDNSDDDATLMVVNKFKSMGLQCIYYRNPEKGFYNSIQSLILGQGDFLKLHNDYTKFKPGCLQKLIDLVIDNLERKTQMLFTDGNLKSGTVTHFPDFDSFLEASSYWNTWSSAFSIWKEDLHSLPSDKEDLNDQFPHTSLLFYNINKKSYLIDDRSLFENSKVAKKGGYNIFYNFCVLYIEMLVLLNKSGGISTRTFKSIKRKMAFYFVSSWYCNSVLCKGDYSFDNSNCIKNILKHYGFFYLAVIIIKSYFEKVRRVIRLYLK